MNNIGQACLNSVFFLIQDRVMVAFIYVQVSQQNQRPVLSSISPVWYTRNILKSKILFLLQINNIINNNECLWST